MTDVLSIGAAAGTALLTAATVVPEVSLADDEALKKRKFGLKAVDVLTQFGDRFLAAKRDDPFASRAIDIALPRNIVYT